VRALIVVGIVVLASGCSTTKLPENASTATTRHPLRCQSVSTDVVQGIAAGLRNGATGLRFAQAVKSDSFKSVYFVSADVEGTAMSGKEDIATWSTNRLESGGLVLSVDRVASSVSDWGSGSSTDAKISMADDGATESQACARAVASVAS
jgi:hypothetical protein